MKRAKILIALILIATAWLMMKREEPDEEPSPEGRTDTPAGPTAAGSPSALPVPDVARLQSVRSAIANTPEGHKLDYEFGKKIVHVAMSLTTDELLEAIGLLDEVGFTIEELCLNEAFPLDRRIAILNRFGDREDQGIADAIFATAHAYAQKDPAATRQWLRQFEPGDGPGQGLEAVFERLDQTDPAASIAMLCDLDDHEAENIIGYGSGPNLKHLSGRERLALVQTFASDKLREFNLRQTVVWYLAEDDPEDALSYIRQLPPNERHANHGRQLVQTWARAEGSDFLAITERIETDLPVEVRSVETYYVLAEAWYNDSPAAAREWIGTLAAGPIRDAAIAGYTREPKEADAPGTHALALTISDPDKRRKTVGWTLQRWDHSDPEAVIALLPDADISDESRRHIERFLKTSGR